MARATMEDRGEVVPRPSRMRERGWKATWWGLIALAVASLWGTMQYKSAIGYWAPFGFVGSIVAFVLLLRARSRRWRRDKARAEALFRRGDSDGAAAILEEACRKVAGPSLKEAHAQLGWVELRRGRLDRAIALFRAADEGPDPTVSTNETKLRIAQGLARAYALAGDAETASAWHARARKLVAPGHEAHLVFEELLIALRRGDFAGVEARAAEAWPAIETTHTGEAIRDLRVLRAFGEANRGESGRPGPHIEAARVNRPGVYDWMAVKWPELGAFLRGNGL